MPKTFSKNNPKCPICSKIAVKNGIRKIKQRSYQRYLCKVCNHSFSTQPKPQKSKTYPLKTILNSISNYNLGQSLRSQQIPKSTLHNWITSINLPMNRLRDKLKHQPTHKIIIRKRFIHHQQPFLYQYHNLKLNFANRYPKLIYYLKNLEELLPKDIFQNSKRISELSKETINIRRLSNKIITKQNYAVQLAKLAASIAKNQRKSHQIIENFMLINDTATIAVEIPVCLNNLTGHIDILQIRYNKLHILDFKPEPFNKQKAISQLFLYRAALSNLADIPKSKIKLAFFNDKGYYEIE